jgi:hypothetical protein
MLRPKVCATIGFRLRLPPSSKARTASRQAASELLPGVLVGNLFDPWEESTMTPILSQPLPAATPTPAPVEAAPESLGAHPAHPQPGEAGDSLALRIGLYCLLLMGLVGLINLLLQLLS